MSATAVYGSVAIICAGALLIGQAVLTACGWRRWSWLAPGVGLASLIVLAGASVRLPGHGAAGAVAIGAAMFASLAYLARRKDLEVRQAVGAGLPVAAIVLLAASVPFAVHGRIDLVGVLVLNDLASHLWVGDWLLAGHGAKPPLLDSGYPIAAHGLAVSVAAGTGVSFGASFTGLLLAVPVLTALAALGLLTGLSPWRRAAAATLAGIPYLAASYLVQSSYKETILGLLVLTMAAGLREIGATPAPRAASLAAPMGLIAAAAIYVYSFPALIWLAGTLAVWAAFELGPAIRRKTDRSAQLRQRIGSSLPQLRFAAGVCLIALAPEAVRFAYFGEGPLAVAEQEVTNVDVQISPFEAFGIWPSPDYRVSPPSDVVEVLSAIAGIVAVGFGALWWSRRGETAVLSSLAAGLLAYTAIRILIRPFYAAKALAIMSPLVMLLAAGALLATAPGTPRWAVARTALALAFLPAAAYSSYLALQGAVVDAPEQGAELAELRLRIGDRPTLFLGRDEFSGFDLRGANVYNPGVGEWPGVQVIPRPAKSARFYANQPFDFDTVSSEDLDRFAFVIASRAAYQSAAPGNFRLVALTPEFGLWERSGPTAARQTLREGPDPGAILRCTAADRRAAQRRGGVAGVFRRPPVVGADQWRSVGGGSADQALRVDLPRGRWRVSLQYLSQVGLLLSARGLRFHLPRNLDRLATFWPAGTIRTGGGPVTLRIRPENRSWFDRTIGRRFTDEQFVPETALGRIAFTDPGGSEVIPLRRACGRYVDWYRAGT